ncbi:MAG TPA: type II toxin-antitoxin system RelE/ParE family toxin [Chloroflexi bacterium]|nr:type II toxin-antitoxin system RelE/ParE family toxin [Chloroflexota bacterium]
MASYNIEWKRSAIKELKKVPPQSVKRILLEVEKLSVDPIPVGSRKLLGAKRAYRIRVGVYRVIYTFEVDRLVVEVIKVGHRKDIYR